MAVRSPPVYFDPDGIDPIQSRLGSEGITLEEIATPKSLPRFVLHFRCTRRKHKCHLLGFTVANKPRIALLAQGSKKEIEFVFQIHDLLLSFGGISNDDHRKADEG